MRSASSSSVPSSLLSATGLKRRHLLALGAAAPFASLSMAQPGAWPTRAIKIVVPFSAGGAGDTSARAVGQRVSDLLGQTVTIDNRTGGNAVVAANALLGAPRDGYTFLWDAANQLTNQVLIKDLQIDYRTAFVPVTMAVRAPQALVVRHDFPARTFDEFMAIARSKPGTVSCGTPPSGAMGHLAIALLEQRAGIKLLHTPYRGGADAGRDVMGSQIDSALITAATARGTLATGKTRILAVTSATRLAAYPDVPTIAERGFPGYDMDDWFGVFAGADTPEGPIKQMQAAVAQAAKDPSLATSLAAGGFVPVGNGTQEFSTWLTSQRELLHKVIRDANIKLG